MEKHKVSEGMLGLVVGFLVLHIIFKIKVLLTIAVVFGLIGVLSFWLSEKIATLWYKLAESIGKVTSTILLSVVFFLFVTPVAFLAKIFRKKDNLQLKHQAGQSVYETRNHQYSAKDLENVW
jgi:hypothetical protein